jgi:hypothetical protein
MHLHFIKTLETPKGCNPLLEGLKTYIFENTVQAFGLQLSPWGLFALKK